MTPQRPLYVIVDWDVHFETYESKRLTRGCNWLALPNKHDGKSFRRLSYKKEAAALYGAWVLAAQVASKMPVRGVLADLDGPLSAEDLQFKTGFPEQIFAKMLELMASVEIGWLRKITDATELEEHLTAVTRMARGRLRRAAGAPADSDELPQVPARSAVRPQVPAASGNLPQLAGTPAGLRESAETRGNERASRARAGGPDRTGPDRTSSPIVPKGDNCDRTAFPENRSTSLPSDSAEKKNGAADLLEPDRSWRICCEIFGRKKTAASANVLHALADLKKGGVLPLEDREWTLLQAFYGAARRDTESREKWHPRDTAETLAGNLLAELDKAQQWARETGRPAAETEKREAVNVDRLHAWFAEQWPEKPLPNSLEDLPEYLRRPAREACSTLQGGAL